MATHTKTFEDKTYDVFKLHSLTNHMQPVMIHLKSLKRVSRSSRSGFSSKRYALTDISYPVLITEDYECIDGRHRICKLIDTHAVVAFCIIVPNAILMKSLINSSLTFL